MDGRIENTQALSQRVKASSVSGFALLSFLERNRAHSAFKRFSQSSNHISVPIGCVFEKLKFVQESKENVCRVYLNEWMA
ncbi:hypothetical protein ACFLRM_02860 [Acidobacteriota bacterium]